MTSRYNLADCDLRGNRKALDMPKVAIVGARKASAAAIARAMLLAEDAAKTGYAVISGGAKGIDNAAARAAHKAGGYVVTISAQGLESDGGGITAIKPNLRLLVASPFPADAPWSVGNAMARNAWIVANAMTVHAFQPRLDGGGGTADAIRKAKAQGIAVFVYNANGAMVDTNA